jgi:hypothetical protein
MLNSNLANSICRFAVFVYIVYSLICSFICNFSVNVLCTVSLRNKDIISYNKDILWFYCSFIGGENQSSKLTLDMDIRPITSTENFSIWSGK